jgi:hypothetical protein
MSDDNKDTGGVVVAGGTGNGGGGEAPKFEVSAVYGALTPENQEFAKRRGYIKPDGSFADPNTWLDGHRSAEKVLGIEKLSIPNLADETQRGQWEGWDRLGAPKDGKGYTFQRPEMPKGPDGQPVAYDEAAENGFRELAAKLRMPQFMFDAIMTSEVGKRMQTIADAGSQMAAEKSRIETALRKDWGQGYDTNMKQAGAALGFMAKEIGADEGRLADFASHEFGSEETARLFARIAQMLGEDSLQGGKANGFAQGPAAARAELERLDMDEEFKKAWMNNDHPGHAQAIERRKRLLATANGG